MQAAQTLGLKINCVNTNNPEKRTNTKIAAKQGNAGERPDAAAEYTVKSSGESSLLFILHRYSSADKLWGTGGLPQWGRCHEVTEGLTDRPESSTAVRLQICPQNKS